MIRYLSLLNTLVQRGLFACEHSVGPGEVFWPSGAWFLLLLATVSRLDINLTVDNFDTGFEMMLVVC